MCSEPVYVPNVGFVSCRKCKQCIGSRINDYVGRAIGEAETATDTLALTLTYGGGDHARAVTLVYKDVQDFLKRLRYYFSEEDKKDGCNTTVRYMVAGEYGSDRGRAHWHLILFIYGRRLRMISNVGIPETDMRKNFWEWHTATLERRINWPVWPHGFTFFERPHYDSYYYVLKYAVKDQRKQASANHFAMSKKPPLGHEFAKEWARLHVEQGLAPQSLVYTFRDVFGPNGKRREFLFKGVTRDNMLRMYRAMWDSTYPLKPMPASEIIEDFEDREVRVDPDWLERKADWEFQDAQKSRRADEEYLARWRGTRWEGQVRKEIERKNHEQKR